jgi:hypothetical protein
VTLGDAVGDLESLCVELTVLVSERVAVAGADVGGANVLLPDAEQEAEDEGEGEGEDEADPYE